MDDCLCTVLRPKRNSEACFNITPPPRPFPLKKKKENNTNILYCLLYDVGGFLVIIWFDNVYRVFSNDVTAAILVSQNNETAAMLVSQTNPLGVELFSYENASFCSNKFT